MPCGHRPFVSQPFWSSPADQCSGPFNVLLLLAFPRVSISNRQIVSHTHPILEFSFRYLAHCKLNTSLQADRPQNDPKTFIFHFNHRFYCVLCAWSLHGAHCVHLAQNDAGDYSSISSAVLSARQKVPHTQRNVRGAIRWIGSHHRLLTSLGIHTINKLLARTPTKRPAGQKIHNLYTSSNTNRFINFMWYFFAVASPVWLWWFGVIRR